MSDTVSLEWIGRTLRQIQADLRAERVSREIQASQIARLASREDVNDATQAAAREIAAVEARVEQLEAALGKRLDQLTAEQSARFDTIDRQLDAIAAAV